MKRNIWITCVTIFIFAACASMGPKGDSQELKVVNKVAIVGFELLQQEPKSFEISVASTDLPQESNIGSSISESPHAEEVYNVLRESLRKDLGWSVLGITPMRASTAYKGAFNKQMKGFRSIPPAPAGATRYLAEGIMDWWAIERLPDSDRAALVRNFGVDAVVVARAFTELTEGFSLKRLYGGGNFKPKMRIELKVYAQDGQRVIWSDGTLEGEATKEHVGHFIGVSSQEGLNKLVVQAAHLAAKRIKESHQQVISNL